MKTEQVGSELVAEVVPGVLELQLGILVQTAAGQQLFEW